MNQVELSRKAGVDQSLISKYIRRDPKAKNPSIKTLAKLAQALKCDLYDLTGLEELRGLVEPPPPPDPEAEALWDIYTSLPDGDTVKELLKRKIQERAQRKGDSE